jgi:2-keto-3-deoxy-6-phosphogluconate aldolase
VALGDAVERMLTSVGISKERVQQWLRVKDCGCARRAKWLNKWGYEQQDRIERVLNKAARWYGIS